MKKAGCGTFHCAPAYFSLKVNQMLHPGLQIFVRKARKEISIKCPIRNNRNNKINNYKRDFSSNTQFISIASSIKLNPKICLCVACFPLINNIQRFYFHTLSGGTETAPPGWNLHVSQWNLFTVWSCLLIHMVNVNHWPTADKAQCGPPSYLRCASLGAAEVSFMLTRLCLHNRSVLQ